MCRTPVTVATVLSFLVAGSPHLAAQCATTLQPDGPLAEVVGTVYAMTTWDPDGTGPLPVHLVVGGENLSTGTLVGKRLLVHDGTEWLDLPLPATSSGASVRALTTYQGALIVGGAFLFQLGTTAVNNIARWDGASWSALDTGTNGIVHSLTVFGAELIAAGDFTQAGTGAVARIARWNGSTWSPLGTGLVGSPRCALPYNGQLYVGGTLSSAGGVALANLARWNGSSWAATGNPNGEVRALAVGGAASLTPGFLYATGAFTAIGGVAAAHVASMTASNTWAARGSGVSAVGNTAVTRSISPFLHDLFVGTEDGFVNLLSGGTWSSTPNGAVPRALTLYAGDVVCGAESASRRAVRRILPASGSVNLPALGIDGAVQALLYDGSDLIAGGLFTTIDGLTVNGVARRSGSTWSALGTGLGQGVRALARLPNGDIVAGGIFAAPAAPATGLARWVGSAWVPLGLTTGAVFSLQTLRNGDLVAGGSFSSIGGVTAHNIAQFDGTAWRPLATGLSGTVNGILELPTGGLIAVGDFRLAGTTLCNYVARWNGSSWSPVGSGFNDTAHTITSSGSNIVVGGLFTLADGHPALHVAQTFGSTWFPVGTGLDVVRTLTTLPNGDVLAGGGNGGVATCARWNGSTLNWTPVSPSLSTGNVLAFATAPNGDVAVGGDFAQVGTAPAGELARLTTSCPALAIPYGNGCTGAGGPLVMTATRLPWLGSSFAARTTGVPATALPVAIFGFQATSTPLAAIVPQGLPGCMQLVSLDSVRLASSAAGAVTTTLSAPQSPALIGRQLRHQLWTLEIGGAGALTGIASSNALTLTIGVF